MADARCFSQPQNSESRKRWCGSKSSRASVHRIGRVVATEENSMGGEQICLRSLLDQKKDSEYENSGDWHSERLVDGEPEHSEWCKRAIMRLRDAKSVREVCFVPRVKRRRSTYQTSVRQDHIPNLIIFLACGVLWWLSNVIQPDQPVRCSE